MTGQTIGTCSLCGGAVRMPSAWHSVVPPTPTCAKCGAVRAEHGPVIPMVPAPRDERPLVGVGSDPLPLTCPAPFSAGGTTTAGAPWRFAVLAALALALLAACGGPPEALRRGTTAAALGVAAIDAPAAEGYAAAHRRALEEAETRVEYDAAIGPWNTLERALRGSAAALLALDAALDAWGAGGESLWMGLGACAVVSLRELVAAADAVGVELPADLRSAVDLIASLAGSACPGRE